MIKYYGLSLEEVSHFTDWQLLAFIDYVPTEKPSPISEDLEPIEDIAGVDMMGL